jgi:protein SCO1/2
VSLSRDAAATLIVSLLAATSACWAAVSRPDVTTASQVELPPRSDEEVAREYFTDMPLLTHDGREVRFFSDVLKGRVVLIRSFYTHCQGITPRQDQVLLGLQEMLGERLGRDVFFVSITVDPERDTPETLQEYVGGLAAGPGWIFLTGKPENVDWVNHKLGQHLENLEDHKGTYMLGNVETTLWMKVPAHGQPLDLYRALQQLLEDEGEPADG